LRERKDPAVSMGACLESQIRARRAGGEALMSQAFRVRAIMKQGTAAGLPETWTRYSSVEAARAGAKLMYHNDRVLRVMMVSDSVGLFVEWIER
jgi:hypothetical protein